MKLADAVMRCLEHEQVRVVFGYPGGAVLPLYESLRRADQIKHILVRQEQAAVHAASGYARATGRVGVAIGTSGPGATNLITGIATAYMDSIPVVILTGQVQTTSMGRDVFQEVDITGATEPFTKHSYLVKHADELPRIMKEAFHIAQTGRPGPVLVDLPVDVQKERIDFCYPDTVSIRGYKPTVHGHIGQVKRALKRLRASRKPLVCVGGGILRSQAACQLQQFVETARLPVVHTLMGIGVLPSDHPLYYGMIGSHGYPYANKAVTNSDLLVVIGARIADRATAGVGVFAENAEVIHIDIDPAEIGKNLGTLIPVVGDAKNILSQLVEGLEPLATEGWLANLDSWKQRYQPKVQTLAANTVDPKFVLESLGEVVGSPAILTADVGQNQMWTARSFPFTQGRQLLTSGGLGTMGYGLPAAIGACIGAPGTDVVAVVGDGGFQMSMHELGTIAQNNLKLTILLFNNQRLGMVRELQDNTFGQSFGIELTGNPDFQQVAKAYGLISVRVTSHEQVVAALAQARQAERSCIVECIVDPQTRTL